MGGNQGDGPNNTKQTCNSRSIFWDSPEAAKLFGCVYGIDDAFKVLSERINLLTDSIQTVHGYKNIIDGNGEHLSQNDVFSIRNRCIFLRRAYIIAQDSLGKETMKWIDGCCKKAVYECNKLGLNTTISARTVAHWNNILSANCGKFPHPNPSIFTRNGRTPLLFEYFPESILDFKKLIFGDYDSFTIERLPHDVISDVIPKYLSKATDIGETSPEYMLLSKYSSHYPMRQFMGGYIG